MSINGRDYPMWQQFVEKKGEFIGGAVEDWDEGQFASTEIINIQLLPNGNDSAYFEVLGKDFNCGFDVRHGGIVGGDPRWITFSGYGGHSWRIRSKENNQ